MDTYERSYIAYRYTFILSDSRSRTFELELDRASLALRPTSRNPQPSWADLASCQCPNCPLDPAVAEVCPIAGNLPELVAFFADAASYDELDVEIGTDERSYLKHTTSSEAVSSLLGIYMVTSGCPVMDKLRPMVRFHLPLATTEETTFRAVAMYLVAQYFVARAGGQADWSLQGLGQIYAEIQKVNQSFAQRLQLATHNDASINALVRLDALASAVVMSIDLDRLDSVEPMFRSYLDASERDR